MYFKIPPFRHMYVSRQNEVVTYSHLVCVAYSEYDRHKCRLAGMTRDAAFPNAKPFLFGVLTS